MPAPVNYRKSPYYIDTMAKILLVGREGNGIKSSVNSINSIDATMNRMVAVKCSGVGDIGADRREPIESVIENVKGEIFRFGGFNAIVFVLKYGVRFTKQEKDAVEMTKKMFGEDVFRRYGVILMTYGDLFEMDKEDNDSGSFIQWCKSQTGDIQKLFEEVSYRIVSFDNKAKDLPRKAKQYNELQGIVNRMNVLYGPQNFERAAQERRHLIFGEIPPLDIFHAVRPSGLRVVLELVWWLCVIVYTFFGFNHEISERMVFDCVMMIMIGAALVVFAFLQHMPTLVGAIVIYKSLLIINSTVWPILYSVFPSNHLMIIIMFVSGLVIILSKLHQNVINAVLNFVELVKR